MSRITGWLVTVAAAAALAGAAGTLVAELPSPTASITATASTWPASLIHQPAACAPDGLACQPYMGWDTYYGSGAGIMQGEVEQQAQAMVQDGLASAVSRSETRSCGVSWGFAAGSVAWLGPSRGAVVARLPLGEVPGRPAGGAGPV
jgi:hypothetical protein